MRSRFVCVRITRMNGIDLRRFKFDYDTTWNSFFLDENLNIYSRYGGRDAESPEGRLSKESLLQTMQEVLDVHHNRATAKRPGGLPLTQPVPDSGFKTPEDMPLLRRNHRGCLHCHQVREYQLLQTFHDGEFTRDRLFQWPLPENVGLKFDRKHGHRLEAVLAESPAEQAGLQPGDTIVGINQIPVSSDYDVRWALQKADDSQPITVTAVRPQAGDEETVVVPLTPGENWRLTDLGWRRSLRSTPFPFGVRGYSLTRTQRRDADLTQEQLAVKVVAVRDTGLAQNLGIQKQDIIVAVGGRSKSRSLEGLQSDLLQLYRPGDEVHLTVLRDGQQIELRGRFPDWFTEETSVP
jgi:serine protease Do